MDARDYPGENIFYLWQNVVLTLNTAKANSEKARMDPKHMRIIFQKLAFIPRKKKTLNKCYYIVFLTGHWVMF